MSSLGKRLIQSAKEARTIARGEADASTYKVFVPARIDVKAIRKRRGLTQEEFASGMVSASPALGTGNRGASRRIRPREPI